MEDINERIKESKGLVYLVLKRYFPDRLYDEDYAQIGTIALWKALETYDEKVETVFSTYAVVCIRNALAQHRKKEERPKRTLAEGETLVYLDKQANESDDNMSYIGELIADNKPEQSLVEYDEFYKTLKDKDKFIFTKRRMGYNNSEIGKMLGISHRTVALRLKKIREGINKCLLLKC